HRAATNPAAALRAWLRHMHRRMPGFPSTHGHSGAATVDVRQRAVIGTSPFHPYQRGPCIERGGPGSPVACLITPEPDKSSRGWGTFRLTLNWCLDVDCRD